MVDKFTHLIRNHRAKEQWGNIFKALKETDCQPTILYPINEKLRHSQRNKNKEKKFPEKIKIPRGFSQKNPSLVDTPYKRH